MEVCFFIFNNAVGVMSHNAMSKIKSIDSCLLKRVSTRYVVTR